MYAIERTKAVNKPTTKRREWWGWLGCAVWMFLMMYGHDTFIIPEFASVYEESSHYPTVFMALLAALLVVCGWIFGKNPNKMGQIAKYCAPLGIVATAIFPLLPNPASSVIYMVTPLFMAPVFTRRLYGVIRSAPDNRRIIRYITGIPVAVATYVIWIALDLPREVTFLIPAAFALIAWMGSWREISAVEELSAPHSFKFSKDAVLLILAFAVVIWLSQTSSVIHTHIIGQGSELDNPLYTIFGFMLPPLSWILYAYLADKGKEHIGFFLGMGLYIIGIQVAFLSGENLNALLIPLTITDGLGGSYAEFFILAAPLIFFSSSKRPVLVASLGLALDLFSAAAAWDSVYWVPEKLLMLQVETLVNAAITSVVFVVLVILLFERHKERTLAALIRKMVIKPQSVLAAPEIAETALQQEKQETAQSEVPVPVPIAERFAPEEQEIAMLLVEGYTKGEIARKLRMTSAEVGAHMMIIRGKVTGADEGSADALLAQAAANYKLTGRETQVLRGLFEGKTNVIIAEEHFISEETVKFHVKNVMKKLPVENRSQIREWVLTGEMAEIS